jgi:hypothetical protein
MEKEKSVSNDKTRTIAARKPFIVNVKLNEYIILLRQKFGLFLSIVFGIFLFVLFFQPFTIEQFDFNNRLLFVGGIAAIIFTAMVLIRVIFVRLFEKYEHKYPEYELPGYFGSFLIWIISTVALAFYLRFVGNVEITFYSMFKIALISLAPPTILRVYDNFIELKQENKWLKKEKQHAEKMVEKYQEDYQNQSIEFISDNNTENLNLLIKDVAFIKSADNYVEIVYKEDDTFKKRLIRNTLKNIELQIKPFANFNRCHRTSIVNTHFIEKLRKNYNNHWLTIKGYDEEIPVSRQYLIKLKEVL